MPNVLKNRVFGTNKKTNYTKKLVIGRKTLLQKKKYYAKKEFYLTLREPSIETSNLIDPASYSVLPFIKLVA